MLLRLLVFLAVTVGILAAAFFGLTRRFTVPSSAMEPTVKKGDHVAVFRFEGALTSPGRKDVVVFSGRRETPACGSSSRDVERIIGLPGETVSDRDGVVSIDGKPLKEPYVKPARRDRRTGTWHVPRDAYLLLGDNRRSPCAAPATVRKRNVVGKVFLTYWPLDRVSIG